MPSLSWRPRPFGIGELRRPRPVEGGADVVARRSSRTSRGGAAAAGRTAPSPARRCGAARCSGRSGPRARCRARAPSRASPTARDRDRRRGSGTDSSNAVVANTTCPKPTPSVRKPPGTQRRRERRRPPPRGPRRARSSTPQGRWCGRGDATRRARTLVVVAVGDVEPGRRRGGRRSRRTRRASTASKPTNTASLAGPACTTSRCARSSSRQVTAPSTVGSPGTSPITSPKNGRERGGVGNLDAEVGESRSDGSWRHSWGRPTESIRRGGRSRGARRTSG